MTRLRACCCCLLLAFGLAPSAGAQLAPTLDVGFAGIRNTIGQHLGVVLLSPAIHYGFRGGRLATTGAVSLFDDGGWGGQGLVEGTVFLSRSFRTSAELQLSAGGASYPGFEHIEHLLAGVQVSGMNPVAGWRAAGRLATAAIGDFRYPGATVEATAWRVYQEWTVSLAAGGTLVQRSDTAWLSPEGLGPVRQTVALGDLSGGLRWSRGIGAVDLTAGQRFGQAFQAEGLWATLTASVRVMPNLTLSAGAGRQPADLLRGMTGGDYAVVSARIGVPSARARAILPPPDRRATTATRPTPDGHVRIRVHLAQARTVALRGDLTEWQPLEMMAAGPGVWELVVPAPSGVHHLCISVDGGACAPPPGVPAVASEFGGLVGVLAVP